MSWVIHRLSLVDWLAKAKTWKQSKWPISSKMNKSVVIFTLNRILYDSENEKTIATNIETGKFQTYY